ncbi:hypothetical protein HYH02_014648 [Chlamydomonas schloesseri]|uniref:Uncharacterized protein n=1 Tax=Chlamydomonas schloesseri TaxID=2026947 RepID=A0A835VVP8_9CHLO|nr:hypothetical protein HYH02_014648 [Chlamydomonas schloesseri]|eukprot:KAG2427244.1 hypothetical protein HYH02_014648 [Chlamydomonas schloesseri]
MANDKRKNGLAAEDVAAQEGKKSKKVKKDQWAKAEEAAPPEEDRKKGKKDKTKHKKGEAAQEAPKSDKMGKKKDKIAKRTEVEEEEAQEAPATKHKEKKKGGYMEEEEELENSPVRGAREAIQQPGKVVTAGKASKRVKAEESLSFLQTELKLAKKDQELAKKDLEVLAAKKDLEVLAAKKDQELAKKDLEVLAAKKDQELANKAAEIAILKAEKQKFQNHKHMVELLAYKKLLTTRGLIEFVEAECMPKAYKGLQRADKWRAYFKMHENLAQCAAHYGFSNPGAEIVTIFRDLSSDDIHNLNATRFMTRFKTELLRFGPPLSLRQAELLVCIATHLGFRSEAHGVLEKTVSP